MKSDFDTQVDKLRSDIIEKIAEICNNPNLSQVSKTRMVKVLNDQSNRLEIARRVHNTYVETGIVKIPQ